MVLDVVYQLFVTEFTQRLVIDTLTSWFPLEIIQLGVFLRLLPARALLLLLLLNLALAHRGLIDCTCAIRLLPERHRPRHHHGANRIRVIPRHNAEFKVADHLVLLG